jgi:hypothetical protein
MAMTYEMNQPKPLFMKEIIDKLYFIKIINFCTTKDNVNKMRSQVKAGRKYLQKTYLIKDCYAKYKRT